MDANSRMLLCNSGIAFALVVTIPLTKMDRNKKNGRNLRLGGCAQKVSQMLLVRVNYCNGTTESSELLT